MNFNLKIDIDIFIFDIISLTSSFLNSLFQIFILFDRWVKLDSSSSISQELGIDLY
jgi:hypothetical protein